MTKQREIVLAAIRACAAEDVPATEAEIVRRTGMRPNAVKAHCEHLGRIKPVALQPTVGYPTTMERRRYEVTIQKGDRKPVAVEVNAARQSEAVMAGLRKAGYEVTVIEEPEAADGAHQNG